MTKNDSANSNSGTAGGGNPAGGQGGNGNQNKSRKQRRMEFEKQKRTEKEFYEKMKERLLIREKNNYSEICVMREAGSTWWKMFGHSAVIYSKKLAEEIGLSEVRLQVDQDYGLRSEEGWVAVKNINELVANLARINVLPEVDQDLSKIFKLGYALTEDAYVALLEQDERQIANTNRLILPEEKMVGLNAAIRDLLKTTHEGVRRMDAPSREAYGMPLEKNIVKMKVDLVLVERGVKSADEYLKEAKLLADEVMGYVGVLLDQKAIAIKKIAAIGQGTSRVLANITKERKRRAGEKIDDEMSGTMQEKDG